MCWHTTLTVDVYVATESGWVSVFNHVRGHLEARGRPISQTGAHSPALNPTTNHIYFPIPKGPRGSSVLWEFEPTN